MEGVSEPRAQGVGNGNTQKKNEEHDSAHQQKLNPEVTSGGYLTEKTGDRQTHTSYIYR